LVAAFTARIGLFVFGPEKASETVVSDIVRRASCAICRRNAMRACRLPNNFTWRLDSVKGITDLDATLGHCPINGPHPDIASSA
jgi:hypothetical protein